MVKLKNDRLEIDIANHGAEVKCVYHLDYELDYLWNSNPEFWARSSPVLFPVVGRLAEDTYLLNGKRYSLMQHGFAGDEWFDVLCRTDTKVWFELRSNAKTLECYPFEFSLKIGYELLDETLVVKWEVTNLSEEVMPFSIGAHPALSTRLQADDQFGDYYLYFESSNGVETYRFDSKTNLIVDEKITIIDKLKFLPLNKELFEEFPTLVVEGESAIALKSYNHDREVEIRFNGFPYVGIWSPINQEGHIADFICLEPWYGMADTVNEPQELSSKKGIQLLQSGETFEAMYTMTFK